MASFYADEDFPRPVVEILRVLGHQVLTVFEAGNANLKKPDESVIEFASNHEMVVLTHNRRHFRRLHRLYDNHAGIILCTRDEDFEALAYRIHETVGLEPNCANRLIRVNQPNRSRRGGNR